MKITYIVPLLIAMVVFFSLGFLFQSKYLIRIEPKNTIPTAIPTDTLFNEPPQNSSRCEVEGCHGMDISCGSNIAQMCNEMYQIGDSCRQFAVCETIGGVCQIKKNERFDTCKQCVQTCISSFGDDPIKLSDCEPSCMN